MATKLKAGAPGQAAALPEGPQVRTLPTADVRQLQEAITALDAISQEGCDRIGSIARLVLMAMEAPALYRSPEVIAQALETIAYLAEETQSSINAEAEALGAHWRDESPFRRVAAYSKFRQEAAR